jgi:hypothetical protein
VPIGTIKSRASALARQGKIQARPKGGAYPHQRHQAAMEPVQAPVQSRAEQGGAVQNSAEQPQTALEPVRITRYTMGYEYLTAINQTNTDSYTQQPDDHRVSDF